MVWYSILSNIVAQAAPAAAAAAAADAGGGSEMSVAIRLILAVGVIASSFVLGGVLARALKMPDFSFKIGLLLFTLFASLVICVVGWPPKRGIDLSGGVVLVYEVERTGSQSASMQAAIAALNEELNAGGGEKLDARPNAKNQIEITVPDGVDVSRVENAIRDTHRRSADLNFSSAGRRQEDGKTVLVYNLDQQQSAVDMQKLIASVARRINPGGVKELTIRQYGAEQLEVIIPEIEEREVEHIKRLISTSGVLEFRIVANEVDDKDIIKAASKTSGRDVYIGGKLVGRWVKAGSDLNLPTQAGASYRNTEAQGREILVRIDPYDVTGNYLRRAAPTTEQGQWAVQFTFDTDGGEKFGQLTSKNLPDTATGFKRQLGIVLDNTMLSAPSINSTIHDNGIIQGQFTEAEVNELVGILNAGSLPATLRPEPISQQRVSSQLGDDTIRKGTLSIVISTAAILVFMAVYYRFCGIVADIAVMLNMIVTVALMILVKAAFTLPGLAGLVLTVGMAVDANVLIYERMREETERGASLRMAIRNGFSRAMATIIDSHVTTLISGVVLYIVGTDQIKGFAVTLIIGLLMSLFTAVFVARVIFDIAERKRWLTKLNMMHLIGHTDIDFIRWRGPAIAVSVLISVVGLAACAARGPGLLDIDFTGGSSVQVLFAKDKPHDIADIRKTVAELEDVAVSSVGENNLEFKIDTSNQDKKFVQDFLKDKFGDSLQTYSVAFGPVTKIEAGKEAEESSKVEGPTVEGPSTLDAAAPEVKPADASQPAPDAKPDDAKPEQATETPKSSDQSRTRSKTIQVASTDTSLALAALATAQDEAAKAESEPVVESPAAAEKAAEQKPADEKPPVEKPVDEGPAQKAAEPATTDEQDTTSLVGGSRVALTFPQKISYPPLRDLIDQELDEMKLTGVNYELSNPKYQFGSDLPFTEWTLSIKLDTAQTEGLVKGLQSKLSNTPVFPSSNQIGGKVAGDTQLMALYALLASMVIIVIYVWFRFENVIFGLAAVLALVHDVLVTIAFLGMSYYLSPFLGALQVDPFKISLAVVAALLTIVGFSINDTIVVFDRIREVRGKSPDLTPHMINLSVNQTLSRTILTSGTVFIASVILYFLGGPGIHAFAFSMVIGVIAGTYSSIYIAAPVLLWMKKGAVAPAGAARQPASRGA